jgi:hypothetical protein
MLTLLQVRRFSEEKEEVNKNNENFANKHNINNAKIDKVQL